MRRRKFISLVASAALACPFPAGAQQKPSPVVGFLRDSSLEASRRLLEEVREGLKQTGFVEGQNAVIEARWSDGRPDRLPELAADLINRGAVVLVGGGDVATMAAKATTASIPIVFATGDDPVQAGIVSRLNQPGGNVTGVTFYSGMLGAKGVEILHELLPSATAIGLLVNPNSPGAEDQARSAGAAAKTLGLELDVVNARYGSDFESAFADLQQKAVGALLIPGNAVFTGQRDQLVALAAQHHLPTLYSQSEFTKAGGLMSYGASITGAYRDVGVYVGRILNGQKLSELPVMQASRFEFVLNLRTAKALNLLIPPSILNRADEVIE